MLAKISELIQAQWRLLRSALDVEGHERRVQQRQAKMRSKQQRKTERRAARAARRAQRKHRHVLLSPTAVGDPTDDEERVMNSSSPRNKQLEVSTVPGGSVWAHTAEALKSVAAANESARYFSNEPSAMRRDTSRHSHETSYECVDEKLSMPHVAKLTVEKAIEAAPQLSIRVALENEAQQLEQKQRNFYESIGGYSTVDEEDDEVLPAILLGGRHAYDAKLSSNWTVVGIKKVAALLQESEEVLIKVGEQEEAIDARPFVASAASALSMLQPRPTSLSSLSELVEREPEDEEVDLFDSAAFESYNILNEEEESRDLYVNDPEINGLYLLPLDNLSALQNGKAIDEALKTKFDPNGSDFGQCGKIRLEGKEEFALSTVLDELETKEPPRMHNFSDQYVIDAAQPLDVTENLSRQELVGSESKEIEEGSESIGGSRVVEGVEMGFKEVSKNFEEMAMIEQEHSLYPACEDMHTQQASVTGSPYQLLVPLCTLPAGTYSPGTIDEYSCSIYESLLTREHRYHVTEDIFAKQESIRPKMRAVLVNWLVEVHQRFDLEAQTLYLTVNYVDRYLAQASVDPQRFQLVGVAALLIASKFEEIYPCDMDDLLYICERSYSKTELVECERDLLNVFKFNLAVPSVRSFLGYYLEHFKEEDKLIGHFANYFAECALLNFIFGATYKPSIIAGACLLAAYCYIENQAPSLVWNYRLVELTGYVVEAIVPCTQDLSSILIQPTELTAVATKYSHNEFGEVACMLLDDLEVLLC